LSIWLIVLITVYVAVFLLFLVAMYSEAPNHGDKVGFRHVVVALFWLPWAIWYLGVLLKDKLKK